MHFLSVYESRIKLPHCIYYILDTLWVGTCTFELMKTPVLFQRFMEICLADYRNQFSVSYLHDVLVYSKQKLWRPCQPSATNTTAFQRKRNKFKSSKWNFFQKQASFLRHIVTEEGYNVDPSLTKPITKLLGDPTRDIAGACKLLSLLEYFHRHISKASVQLHNNSMTCW